MGFEGDRDRDMRQRHDSRMGVVAGSQPNWSQPASSCLSLPVSGPTNNKTAAITSCHFVITVYCIPYYRIIVLLYCAYCITEQD
jgi:hypothetical protein